ncbi:penicillin-binding transpeptidase domain-containing protein [Trebonia sp.]|uniref:penicillin-binding transpeptidase domain-containing protein n=1 Tax=Trebonia sp. TaxID=2767075 RepID=UPI00260B5920|nr:penicillin-binding transpeptidase domain-containing protein [Trebonia sp.]
MSRRQRTAAVLVIVVGLLTIGFATGFGSEASAEPAVQAFLFDWQQGKYAQAAALTNGNHAQVAAQLAAAYTDLDATDTFFAMDSVTQHGDTAVAVFKATVDMGEGGNQWTYNGRFGLAVKGGQWLIDWAPEVINPGLGPGDRLAVLTAFAPRAQVEDTDGLPLLTDSTVYHVGVYPGRLANAARTAGEFSQIADLNSQQVLGQIQAAPPRGFLSLLALDPAAFHAIWPRLAKVPGLSYVQGPERLFDSIATEVVGTVGTEDSSALRAEGAAYQPGATVGLTGLEQAYQGALAGTPTTTVLVVNAAGRTVARLWTSQGRTGVPLRTTLVSRDQDAAAAALAGQPDSGEIVAVDAANGGILALASREAGTVALPPGGVLNARLEPGMAFSIVSAAALLGAGYTANTPLPCQDQASPGGSDRSSSATFASDFADGCAAAFAAMSQKLTPAGLAAVERSFGVGATWNLHVQAFSGSAPTASDEAGLAAQATGAGGVLMSPLGMAMVAAEVDAGTGHAPVLVTDDPPATWQAPLSAAGLSDLRQLMRDAVRSGAARAANVSGEPVYGQAGIVQTGAHSWLSWFVGYRGSMAVAVLETGTSPAQSAAALAGAFLSATG